MIYVELQISGVCRILEFDETTFIQKNSVEARAEQLPPPRTHMEAREYWSRNCHILEVFRTLDAADNWAESYTGFRADEVRACLGRFRRRKEETSKENICKEE